MRHILSVAWVGHGDFGDEAMAFALRTALSDRKLPAPAYYRVGTEPKYQAENENVLVSFHPDSRRSRFRKFVDRIKLRPIDTVIIGGGSIFHSESSIAWKHDVVKRVKNRHGDRAAIACIGVSVGPFAGKRAEELFTELAADVDLWIMRDSRSASAARSLGVPAEKIITAVDLSFLLPEAKESSFPLHQQENTNGSVGISFVSLRGESEKRFEYFKSIVDRIIREANGRRVKLFNLYTGTAYADTELNKRLTRESVAPESVDIHTFDGDIFRTAMEISKCSGFLSMRLHGSIFSYLSRVPFVSLGYDPKCRQFCDTVGYPENYALEIDDAPDASAVSTTLFDAMNDKDLFADTDRSAAGLSRLLGGLDRFAELTR